MKNAPSRGRWILTIGAVLIVGACFLQWWQIGGGVDQLPAHSASGFSATTGAVFPMFLAAVASLLLITLPYASEHPIAIDHPMAYSLLFAIEVVCYLWTVVGLYGQGLIPFPPQMGVGFWLAAVGILVVSRGVFEFYEEFRHRFY